MLAMYQHLHYHFPPASRKKGKENLNIKGNSAKKKVLLFQRQLHYLNAWSHELTSFSL